MTPRPKQIVIDKDAFIGINLDALCEFAKGHALLLSATLLHECMTTDTAEPSQLIGRFKDLLAAGARVSPSIEEIVHQEAERLVPYGGIAVKPEDCSIDFHRNVENAERRYSRLVGRMQKTAQRFHDMLAGTNPELLAEMRACSGRKRDRSDRVANWLNFIDSQDIHVCSQIQLAGVTTARDKFCLSSDWVTWHLLRLCNVICMEQAFLAHHGGPTGAQCLEHDLQDILYVVLLSRADGLLSRDKNLVLPLARAAFPEKDVFSSLEAVPESYRCDWAGLWCV